VAFIGTLQTALVEPPVNLLLVLAVGLALMRDAGRRGRRRRVGGWIAALGFTGLVVLSLPATAWVLLRSLETGLVLEPPEGVVPGAIVVLSAEDLRAVPGGIVDPPDLGPLTLQRLRAGALLHRRTGLPILVSGGVLRTDTPPIAQAMARVLASEFDAPARWVEDRSLTTWENAGFSTALLRADGVQAAYVVTHAWHMRRSLFAFRHTGLPAVAAPTHFTGPARLDLAAFVPSPHAWADCRYALHEWIGLAWYAMKDRG
jgi:uncharacterized SAM-binding protein YcdF (DUF218 family)